MNSHLSSDWLIFRNTSKNRKRAPKSAKERRIALATQSSSALEVVLGRSWEHLGAPYGVLVTSSVVAIILEGAKFGKSLKKWKRPFYKQETWETLGKRNAWCLETIPKSRNMKIDNDRSDWCKVKKHWKPFQIVVPDVWKRCKIKTTWKPLKNRNALCIEG